MNAATHPVMPEDLMAWIDGELAAGNLQSVSTHIEQCGECKATAESLRKSSHALSAWKIEGVPSDGRFEKLTAEAERVRPGSGAGAGHFVRRHRVLATCGAVALGAFLALTNARHHSQMDGWMATEPQARTYLGHPVDNARVAGASGSADANGVFRGLGDRGRNSFSINEKPIAEQQARLFTNLIPQGREALAGPMIARTVSLSIVANDFGASRAALDGILAKHHGYAATLSAITQQNVARFLQASLRVPAAELGAVMAELKSLGRVQNETQGGEEVTQQHADLVARLKNSRETEARLQDILRDRTGKISDVLAVEQEIARVRGEIEQMEAEQKNLENRVDFATVDLNLSEEYKAQLGTPAPSISTRFHNALVTGIRNAQEMVVGIALFCAEAGPSLLIWALLLLPVGWFFWRRWRRSYGLASSASL